MARLTILEFPDPRLRTRARPVGTVDDSVRALAADMFETMYAAPGIGLAATQVDRHVRLIVIDITDDRSNPIVLIDPELTNLVGEQEQSEG
jgi:peptide deformylase